MKLKPWLLLIALLALAAVVVPACDDDDDDDDDDDSLGFDPADFQSTVDSPYFALAPGTIKTFAGSDGEAELEVTTTVMAGTTDIAGVACTVLVETEYEDGELVEISINWFAQEIATGDAYYFGEEVDEYEDGEITGHEGAWKVGEDTDMPGLIFPGDPQLGDVFNPESVPDLAEESAEIVEIGLDYSTPFGDFSDVIRVEETDIASGEVEWKLYAPGVGLIAEVYEEGELPLVDME